MSDTEEQAVTRLAALWVKGKKVVAYIAAGLALFGIGHTNGSHNHHHLAPTPTPTVTRCQW